MHESGLLSPRRLRSSRPVTLSNSVISRMVISRPWESVLRIHRLCSQNLGLRLRLLLCSQYQSCQSCFQLRCQSRFQSHSQSQSQSRFPVTFVCSVEFWIVLDCFGLFWISVLNVQSEGKVYFKEGKGRSQLLYQLSLGH